MEAASSRLLYESTLRILHSHSFSRSSHQSISVLSDVLARYLTLLATTSVRYAQHAGRRELCSHDFAAALDELGVHVDELKGFLELEAKDMSRYAWESGRRKADLTEMNGYLKEGLTYDPTDSQKFEYKRLPTPTSDSEPSAIEEDSLLPTPSPPPSPPPQRSYFSQPNLAQPPILSIPPPQPPQVNCDPTLPLSPISNPSSPTLGPRKRVRLNDWESRDYIPDFLPAFPAIHSAVPVLEPPESAAASPREFTPTPGADTHAISTPTPTPVPEPDEPEPEPEEPPTAEAKASYRSSVPYERSTISSKSTSHLPKTAHHVKRSFLAQEREQQNQTHLALLTSQHYLLTNPPPPPETQLPARHSLALALLQGARKRYGPPDSLYAVSEPNKIRLAGPTPTFPIAINPVTPSGDGKSSQPGLPQLPKSVVPSEPLATLSCMQGGRISAVARLALTPALHRKATRLAPPPAQTRDGRKLTYGPGAAAPWNASHNAKEKEKAGKDKGKSKAKELEKEKEQEKAEKDKKLPDAMLYATWNWEPKDFKQPIPASATTGGGSSSATLKRARLGSLSIGVAGKFKGEPIG